MTYERLVTKILRTIKDLRSLVKATVVRMHQKGALISAKISKKNFRGQGFAELALGLSLGPTAWGSEKLVHRNMFLPPYSAL